MKTKKSKMSKIIAGTLALTAVAAVVAGGTFAFLTARTEEKINNFSFQVDSLDANLTESDWDGIVDYDGDTPIYGYNGNRPIYGYVDGSKNNPVYDSNEPGAGTRPTKETDGRAIVYGEDEAKEMIPGTTARKSPIITNTGTVCDEWVAAKITFVYGKGSKNAGKPVNNVDMQQITDIISIDYKVSSGDKWERVEGDADSVSQVFYYKDCLKKRTNASDAKIKGEKTKPIFTKVTVKETATNEQIKKLEDMGGFAIYIEGFGAQKEVGENYAAFKTWGQSNIVFTHTPTNDNPASF